MNKSKDRIKILYIDHSRGPGGAAVSLLELVRHLDQEIFDIVIVVPCQEIQDFYTSHGIKTVRCDVFSFGHVIGNQWSLSLKGLKGAWQWIINFRKSSKHLQSILLKIQPDIVHVNSVTLTPYIKSLKKWDIPVIVHVRESVVHGYLGIEKKWLRHSLEKYADEIIFICHDNKKTLDSKKGMVIYNPVDFSKYGGLNKVNAKKKLGINKNSKAVLYVGGLISIKGPFVLANALRKIGQEIPNVTFLMPSALYSQSVLSKSFLGRYFPIASRTFRTIKRFEKVVQRDTLQHTIIRSEFSHNIEEYYAASDVLVVPFTKPHFARPVMEAGATGIPVVASRIGGISEVVDDGKNGFLFTPGNSEELAEKVIRCLKDDHEAKRMGDEGFKMAKPRFDGMLHAKHIMEVYKNLVNLEDSIS